MAGFLILGPLSKDTIIQDGIKTSSLGGAVYYQSLVFSTLQVEHTAVVTLSWKDRGLLDHFPKNTIIKPVFKKDTVNFENKYLNNDPNCRSQRSNAPKISITRDDLLKLDLSELDFQGIILSPLLPWDLPLDTLNYLYQTGVPLYAGAQGYLRDIKQDKIILKPCPDFYQVLERIKILFLDQHELGALKKNKDESPQDVTARLLSYGLEEIVVTCGDKGSFIYSKHQSFKIKAYPPAKVVDPTGLGDTYLAAYLACKSQNSDSLKCGKLASYLASLKLENKKAPPGLLDQYGSI